MNLTTRIQIFTKLGFFLKNLAKTLGSTEDLEYFENNSDEISMLLRAQNENGWFTKENIQFSLSAWADVLNEENLKKWTSAYQFKDSAPKTIAVIMAGNIPLVGFHDFLSVLISGNKIIAKLSSNDTVLLPLIANFLKKENPEFRELIEFTDGKLENFNAVIATGSDNTSRYFEYYFSRYPNIIRKNRKSIAILSGNESVPELELLMNDIFQYFGLGCRNVSKIFVPENYDFKKFFQAAYSWKNIIYNHKYMNNYDYNKAVYLMSDIPLLDNEFLLLKKDEGFSSPIAVLFYEEYKSLEELHQVLESRQEEIQCVVSGGETPGEISFGKTQQPELWEYADGIDTLKFLLSLKDSE